MPRVCTLVLSLLMIYTLYIIIQEEGAHMTGTKSTGIIILIIMNSIVTCLCIHYTPHKGQRNGEL